MENTNTMSGMDDLVWHYERERRMKIRGFMQWTHDVLSAHPDRKFLIKVNFDFMANSRYLDVLFPSYLNHDEISSALDFLLINAKTYANTPPVSLMIKDVEQNTKMSFPDFPESDLLGDHCQFTGRIFVYTSQYMTPEGKSTLAKHFQAADLFLVVRDKVWIEKVQKLIDRPVVFLGHDSRDKDELVRSLAHHMNGESMKVWFDEFELKPGMRLRKSLDDGLESADYFIPVITPNFLENPRYAQYEMDSILHKYITERKPIIVPVCSGVDPGRLKEVSRLLADTIAIDHKPEHSIENLANQISNVVNPKMPAVGKPLPPIIQLDKPGFFSVSVGFRQKSPTET